MPALIQLRWQKISKKISTEKNCFILHILVISRFQIIPRLGYYRAIWIVKVLQKKKKILNRIWSQIFNQNRNDFKSAVFIVSRQNEVLWSNEDYVNDQMFFVGKYVYFLFRYSKIREYILYIYIYI